MTHSAPQNDHLNFSFVKDIHVVGEKMTRSSLNPNWHKAGHFYPPCNFGNGICQLNLSQKFPNFFGGENSHQSG